MFKEHKLGKATPLNRPLRHKQCRAPTAIFYPATSLPGLVQAVQVVQSLRFVQNVQPKAVQRSKVQDFKVCARSASLFALDFRGKKTLRSVRARLYDHLKPCSSFDRRHRSERHRRQCAVNCRPHRAGIQSAQRPAGSVVRAALWGQVFIFAVLLCGSSSGESMQAATDKWHETGAIMGVAS